MFFAFTIILNSPVDETWLVSLGAIIPQPLPGNMIMFYSFGREGGGLD